MNKQNIGIALVILLFLGGVGTWKLMGDGESAEFTQVKQLQAKLINDKTISDEERDAGWKEVKEKWSSFSPEEQRKLRSQHGQKKQEGMAKYFELETEEERLAHIDQVLDEWEAETSRKKSAQQSNKKKRSGDPKGKSTKDNEAKNAAAKKKQYDHDAMREGLRNYLDGKSADERAKERIYWQRVKQRWAERHGVQK